MALQKELIDEKGITASYFRVSAIIEQYSSDVPVITVQLLGYADQTYRDREKQSVGLCLANSFKEIILPQDDEQGYTRTDIYKRLTTETPDFAGSKQI